MTKLKHQTKIVSYGIYNGWNRSSKELPRIFHFCDEIPARINIEFGMIVQIKHAKGKSIHWCIDHPQIPGDHGEILDPFEGQMRIKSADWKFFLGDTIWEPPDNKMGPWHLWVKLDGNIIAEKTFLVVKEDWSHPI